MAYDFPASPFFGAIFAPAGGPTWQWNGTAWTNVSPANLVPEAPQDGQNYVRRNGLWVLAPGTAEAKNRIVNPAMQISQENGNSGSSANMWYAADQWYVTHVSGGSYTIYRAQSVTPNGSKDRFGIGVNTADTSIAAADFLIINQNIEGIRVADFRWGSASAKQAILRFGWKSPAGTYSVSIRNGAANRSYIAQFTISAGQANTDTEQVLVIPGDVTGTYSTDTSVGIGVAFTIAVGTNYQGVAGWQAGNLFGTATNSNGLGTVANSFFLSDVGLYLDPQNTGIAPPWQMPDEAQELAACQRYWQKYWIYVQTAANRYSMSTLSMRTLPAVTGGGTGWSIGINDPNTFTVYQTTAAYQTMVLNARM